MGLERRGNGLYYYEKERIGSKVRSVYRGGGVIALLAAEAAEEERGEREAQRRERDAGLEEVHQAAREFEETDRAHLATIIQLAAEGGFHRPQRGPWRRRRA